MGVAVSTGNTSVTGTISSGLPVPSSSQTIINKNITTNAGVQTVHTVTTGKTFYLMGFTDYGASGNLQIMKTDGSTQVMGISYPATGQFYSSTSPIWAYASGEFVKIISTTGCQFNCWGFEQ